MQALEFAAGALHARRAAVLLRVSCGHSLSTSLKAVPASRDVGKLKGEMLDTNISYSMCRSASRLPVRVMTVFPPSVLVTVGPLLPWVLGLAV
jgi:hypothetical protein